MKPLVEQIEELPPKTSRDWNSYNSEDKGRDDIRDEIIEIVKCLDDLRCCGNCQGFVEGKCGHNFSIFYGKKMRSCGRCKSWHYHYETPWLLPIPKEGEHDQP